MKLFWYAILGYFRREHFSDGVNHASLQLVGNCFYDVDYKQDIKYPSTTPTQNQRYWEFVHLVSSYIKDRYRIKENKEKIFLDPLVYNNAGNRFEIKKTEAGGLVRNVIEKIRNRRA